LALIQDVLFLGRFAGRRDGFGRASAFASEPSDSPGMITLPLIRKTSLSWTRNFKQQSPL
jgi:hypothetical protein